ncbi:MAG: Ribonuclease H [Parcubacteria group bacterium GW2011_GWC1_43_12]|nr:MAG: Ribonuclease H [Parcubacteria group bacterium GW2011_GWB1_42_6]KKS91721.1 MAG: Ribonuclease H [Parcubacteria group bacterium GW2011_GWC1_43_12]
MRLVIYTDGGSRGNPGPAAIGFVICNEKEELIKQHGQVIENTTNNEAEYQALIFALKKVKALFGGEKAKDMELEIRMDSELIVKQMNHEYRVSEENLQPLFIKVWNLLIDFGKYKFIAIPREKNREADRLVNEALDAKQENLF